MGDLEGESWLSAPEFNMNLIKMDWIWKLRILQNHEFVSF